MAVFDQYLAGSFNLLLSALAAGVVYNDHKIALPGSMQTIGNLHPGVSRSLKLITVKSCMIGAPNKLLRPCQP